MVTCKTAIPFNIFYLQRYNNNDLLTEALFSLAYTQSSNTGELKGYNSVQQGTNWRSREALNSYLINTTQSWYNKLSCESKNRSKRKRQPITKQTLKFQNIHRLKRRKVFSQAPYYKFSTTLTADANVRNQLLASISELVKGLKASTTLGYRYIPESSTIQSSTQLGADTLSTNKTPLILIHNNPLFMKTALTYNFFFKYITTRSLFKQRAFNNQALIEFNQLFHPFSTPNRRVTNIAISSSFTYELQRRLVKSFESSR
jgi:hypothetical protein